MFCTVNSCSINKDIHSPVKMRVVTFLLLLCKTYSEIFVLATHGCVKYFFSDMPTSHLRDKIYKYSLFYFPVGRNVGTAPTVAICEGYRNKIRENQYVILNWEGSQV